jgi:hypothetical protein
MVYGKKTKPLQYPEDEDRGGPQNVGFLAVKPLDVADNLRRFY